MAEFIKIGFSICMIMMSKGGGGEEGLVGSPTKGKRPARVKHMTSHFMQLLLRSHKMLVLAVIYGVGNRLSYYALARVGERIFILYTRILCLTLRIGNTVLEILTPLSHRSIPLNQVLAHSS